MVAGFQHHFGRAQDRLRRQFHRDVAGQSHLHAAFGKRFQDHVNVGRAAGGKPGHGVHELLVYLKGLPTVLKSLRAISRSAGLTAVPQQNAVMPAPTIDGVFGHRSNDGDLCRQALLDVRGWDEAAIEMIN